MCQIKIQISNHVKFLSSHVVITQSGFHVSEVQKGCALRHEPEPTIELLVGAL